MDNTVTDYEQMALGEISAAEELYGQLPELRQLHLSAAQVYATLAQARAVCDVFHLLNNSQAMA